MDLPEALRKQKENFLKAVPEETVTTMGGAIEELSNSGILDTCLKPGETAPDFTLADSQGKQYSLADYLGKSSVVLKFFRGDW